MNSMEECSDTYTERCALFSRLHLVAPPPRCLLLSCIYSTVLTVRISLPSAFQYIRFLASFRLWLGDELQKEARAINVSYPRPPPPSAPSPYSTVVLYVLRTPSECTPYSVLSMQSKRCLAFLHSASLAKKNFEIKNSLLSPSHNEYN